MMQFGSHCQRWRRDGFMETRNIKFEFYIPITNPESKNLRNPKSTLRFYRDSRYLNPEARLLLVNTVRKFI